MRLIAKTKRERTKNLTEVKKTKQKPRKYNKPNKCNFICDICGLSFELRTSIKAHFNLHLNKYESCATCGSKFTSKSTLKRHIEAVHEKVSPRKRKPSEGDRLTINCYVCDKLFESRFLCQLHEATHLQEQLYCDICSKTFTSKKGLKLHTETHNGNAGRRTCEICGAVLSNNDSLRAHIKAQHKDDSKFTCGVCSKSFKHRGSYNDHIAGHLDPRVKRCEICNLEFNSRTACHAHKRRKHPNIKIICALPTIDPSNEEQMKIVRLLRLSKANTGSETKNKGGKTSHLENIGRNLLHKYQNLKDSEDDYYENFEVLEEYEEEVGDFLKNQKSNLKQADSVLKSSSTEAVESVPPTIQSNSSTKTLSNSVLEGTEELLICKFCPKAFNDQAKKINHEQLHSTNSLFCDICNIHFQRVSAKLQHDTKRHQQSNQFHCAHCPEKFSAKRTLLAHLEFKCSGLSTRPILTNMRRSKQGAGKEGDIDWSSINGAPDDGYTIRSWLLFNTKKKVICETCGSTSSTEYSAMEHSRKVHGIIPEQYEQLWKRDNFRNQCPSCGKYFDQISKLYIHQKCHNLEIFTCDVCGVQLKGSRSFMKHQASHGPKSIECPQCDRKFTLKERLAVHLKEKHSLVKQYVCNECQKEFRYRSHYREHLRKHHAI